MNTTIHHRGFTLLELAVVILLMGILAASAASRFFTADDSAPQQQRDLLVQLLRQVQLRSMQDVAGLNSRCPKVVIRADAAAMADTAPCGSGANFSANAEHISFAGSTLSNSLGIATLRVHFDAKGQPQGACSAGCSITLSGDGSHASYQLCLHSSGYISPC